MPRPKKGERTPGSGRVAGVPNKTTTAAKEAFRLAFEGIGGYKALAEWATENRTEFYKLYARLIPVDVTTGGEKLALTQTIVIGGQPITF